MQFKSPQTYDINKIHHNEADPQGFNKKKC